MRKFCRETEILAQVSDRTAPDNSQDILIFLTPMKPHVKNRQSAIA
ncbi:hypothetical protein CKA32_001819 [Geitlerinema sp. FC II]|nr:hypothetical protein CKA32_001819 [Geitlerinema sp. FC II]